jgi:hypothetical protein
LKHLHLTRERSAYCRRGAGDEHAHAL